MIVRVCVSGNKEHKMCMSLILRTVSLVKKSPLSMWQTSHFGSNMIVRVCVSGNKKHKMCMSLILRTVSGEKKSTKHVANIAFWI